MKWMNECGKRNENVEHPSSDNTQPFRVDE